MKEIQTKSGKILCVEIPKNAYDFTIYDNGVYFKPTLVQYTKYGEINPHPSVNFSTYNLKLKIVGKLSELTDKDCEEFVEFNYPFDGQYDKVFRNYLKLARNYLFNSAKESFTSLLQSEGVDTSKEYLIIRVL